MSDDDNIVIELKDIDCACTGDQYGWATHPECLLHGDNRQKDRDLISKFNEGQLRCDTIDNENTATIIN